MTASHTHSTIARAEGLVRPSVERYLAMLRPQPGPAERAMRDLARGEGLPLPAPDQLALVAAIVGGAAPRTAVELGTGLGLTTLTVARALDAGAILASYEPDPIRQGQAHELLGAEPVDATIELRLGSGERDLVAAAARLRVGARRGDDDVLAAEVDLVLLGDDPVAAERLLDPALAILRPGGTLLAGGLLQGGTVAAPDEPGEEPPAAVEAARTLNRRLVTDPRIASATVAPVGDGLAIAVRSDLPG